MALIRGGNKLSSSVWYSGTFSCLLRRVGKQISTQKFSSPTVGSTHGRLLLRALIIPEGPKGLVDRSIMMTILT